MKSRRKKHRWVREVLVFMTFCIVFYKADLELCIFFSCLSYSLLFLAALYLLFAENIFISREEWYALEHNFLLLPMDYKTMDILLLEIVKFCRIMLTECHLLN